MLLPLVVLADVIACRLMELSTVGGRWNSHWVNALVVILMFFCNTSSHMCGRWYLPMFLLRDRSLTLMNRAFFNCSGKVLVLPSNYAEVVDISFVT